jgi:hypothetical protein
MKSIAIIVLLLLVGCSKESSPEGRSKIRDGKLQVEIDSLKLQNKAILEDIRQIKEELNMKK